MGKSKKSTMIQNLGDTASDNYKIERTGIYFFRQIIQGPLFETSFPVSLIHSIAL